MQSIRYTHPFIQDALRHAGVSRPRRDDFPSYAVDGPFSVVNRKGTRFTITVDDLWTMALHEVCPLASERQVVCLH